jgi:hypothetical protein
VTVAEPHVRDLVHDGQRDLARLGLRHGVGIDEQCRLAEGHAPEVLHRAEREVGKRHEIELGRGVRDPVVVGEVPQREGSDLFRERPEVAATRCVDQRNGSCRRRPVRELEPADDDATRRRHRMVSPKRTDRWPRARADFGPWSRDERVGDDV